ncbi:hypothetical protein Tco_0898631 [Tanacetum coccineum]
MTAVTDVDLECDFLAPIRKFLQNSVADRYLGDRAVRNPYLDSRNDSASARCSGNQLHVLGVIADWDFGRMALWESNFAEFGSGYQQKDRKPSQNDKTEHGMEKTVQNQGQRPKKVKVKVNPEESTVKPEPELKNTIGCNLNPSDGPGKPNSITMKTVKTLKAQS